MKRDTNPGSGERPTRHSPVERTTTTQAERKLNYGHLPGLVGYQVRKAHSRLFQTFTETLKDIGLAPAQYNALLLIALNPGLSQMALADATGIDRTTIVPITSRFAKLGWIRRTRRTEDRRVYSLRLTALGEAVLAEAQPLIEEHEKEFVAALKPAERALMRTLLTRLADIEPSESTDASKAEISSADGMNARSRPQRKRREQH